MRLIDNAKQAWRFLSVQLGLLGAGITAYVITDPVGAVSVLQAVVPVQYVPYIGPVISVIGVAARLIKQPALQPPVAHVGDNDDGHK